jgi:hypothetical protein
MHALIALAVVASAISLIGCPSGGSVKSRSLGGADQMSGNAPWHWPSGSSNADRPL